MPISEIIMPSQTYAIDMIPWTSEHFGKKIKINVNEKTELDAREYLANTSDSEQQTPCSKKVIIHACGNGDFHENHYSEYYNQANSLHNCKVVGFNFRNVLRSTGGAAKSEKDWVEDAIAVIDYYHNVENVPYSHILLSGHSLGSAILTMAAAEIHKREQARAKVDKSYQPDCVKLINGRSFKNLGSVVCNIGPIPYLLGILTSVFTATITLIIAKLVPGILVSLGLSMLAIPFSPFIIPTVITVAVIAAIAIPLVMVIKSPSTIAAIYTPIVNSFLSLVFGKMDALKAYKSLPENCKDFYFARGDGIISGDSGLESGVYRNEKQKIKQELKKYAEPSLEYQKLKIRLFELRSKKLRHNNNTNGMHAHNDNLNHFKISSKKINSADKLSGEEVVDKQVRNLLGL